MLRSIGKNLSQALPPTTGEEDQKKKQSQQSGILSSSKKIKKTPKKDHSKYTLKHVSYPIKLNPSEKCKKRYAIQIQYLDGDKMRTKKIRFGKEGKLEFIDHKDHKKRLARVTRLKNDDNFLDHSFYESNLLNSKFDNIDDAYINLNSELGFSHSGNSVR